MAGIAEKWERRMAEKGIPHYTAYAKSPKTEEWARRVGEAFDVTVGPVAKSQYEKGVKEVTPEKYESAVRGKGAKLVEKAREGLAV
jgi:hypothetical protein